MQEQIKKPHEECVKVRPHHGLCAEFFKGEGYSGEFVENMSTVLSMLDSDDPLITLTVGTDRICSRCPHNMGDRCETDQKVSRYDNAVLKLCGLSEGSVLRWRDLRAAVRKNIISPGRLPEVCGDCAWYGICGDIAFTLHI